MHINGSEMHINGSEKDRLPKKDSTDRKGFDWGKDSIDRNRIRRERRGRDERAAADLRIGAATAHEIDARGDRPLRMD